MNDNRPEGTTQLPLFSGHEKEDALSSPPAAPVITPHTPLKRTLELFQDYMKEQGFTENTQQAFRLDMNILADYAKSTIPIGDISTKMLDEFLEWMQGPRGVPCNQKTLERRITTLKVFFGWLAGDGVLEKDPAAPIVHQAVSNPLPVPLTESQIQMILSTAQAMRQGNIGRKADIRPYVLITLILHTGIKKNECVNLHITHIDLREPEQPALWVRYKKPERRHKERRIPLPDWWPAVFREYREQYEVRDYVFPWTARNLEYVLTAVAKAAEIQRLTFEILRWTCAVRDYVQGMEPEELRRKLGLSEISWYEVETRLALLAQQYPKK